MKLAWSLGLASGILLAQGRVGPVGHGFGNVVFPGTGIPQPTQGHIPNLSSTIRGVYPGGGFVGGVPGRPGRPQARPPVVVPVPVFVGGYGYGYGYGAPEPQVMVINAPPVQPMNSTPSVIINQHYTPDRAQPVMREYDNNGQPLGAYQAPVPSHPEPVKPARAAANDDSPTIYLIALKDGTVYSAYAYWLEGDTLHYITTKHSHNRTSLPLVDESVSLQLNRERSVEFKFKGR